MSNVNAIQQPRPGPVAAPLRDCSANDLAEVTGGTWHPVPPRDLAITGVSIDTRTLRPGEVFVAIEAERDGHDFLQAASQAGASCALVRKPVDAGPPQLVVADTVAALQAWAAAHRDRLAASGSGGCKVISVSGSNGKTTTRHLIHHVLTGGRDAAERDEATKRRSDEVESRALRGTQSPASFNNHLGVPLTLLAATPPPRMVTTSSASRSARTTQARSTPSPASSAPTSRSSPASARNISKRSATSTAL